MIGSIFANIIGLGTGVGIVGTAAILLIRRHNLKCAREGRIGDQIRLSNLIGP